MDRDKEIKGYFLTFTDEESGLLREVLEDQGEELSPEGIKNLIFEMLHDMMDVGATDPVAPMVTAADRVIDGISRFVKENPDKIRMYASLAGSFIKKVGASKR
jgi:hypothetical protein